MPSSTRFLLCAVLTIMFCAASPHAFAAAWEDNTNRPGYDYDNFTVASGMWEDCATPCADDIRCMAYTFVRPAAGQPATCWRKTSAGTAVADACCMSGTITRTQQGVALADLTDGKWDLRDEGEQTFAVITFNQGVPGYQAQGTLAIDDVTVTFGGNYNQDGWLDLYLAVPKGSMNLRLLVRRTSYPNPALGHAQLVGTGTLSAPNDSGSNEVTTANLVGTCSYRCPY